MFKTHQTNNEITESIVICFNEHEFLNELQ